MITRFSDRVFSGLRALRDGQAGQSLVVVVLSMAVTIAVAAFAIDVASWYQQHHQAQVGADAAALAAANCLANGGTGQKCTSDLDYADATNVAIQYAKNNGITITANQVTYSGNVVTVSAKSTAPAFFARLFGIETATVSAGAGASFTSSIPCAQADQLAVGTPGCAAIYAGNSTCTSGTGINVGTSSAGGASLKITGVVHSEGEMVLPSGGSSNASGFSVAQQTPSGGCYTTTSALPATGSQTATLVSSFAWPVNYHDYLGWSCPTASSSNCSSFTDQATNSPIWAPSYCTVVSTGNFDFTSTVPAAPNAVYCALGSGGFTSSSTDSGVVEYAQDPNTWTGSITFDTSVPAQQGAGNCTTSTEQADTFIGGSINANSPKGALCLKPASGLPSGAGNLLFYATQPDQTTSTGTVPAILIRQQITWSGDMFAPYGTIQLGGLQGGGNLGTTGIGGLIEGLNVNLVNDSLTLTGDGPVVGGGGGGTTTNVDKLVQ